MPPGRKRFTPLCCSVNNLKVELAAANRARKDRIVEELEIYRAIRLKEGSCKVHDPNCAKGSPCTLSEASAMQRELSWSRSPHEIHQRAVFMAEVNCKWGNGMSQFIGVKHECCSKAECHCSPGELISVNKLENGSFLEWKQGILPAQFGGLPLFPKYFSELIGPPRAHQDSKAISNLCSYVIARFTGGAITSDDVLQGLVGGKLGESDRYCFFSLSTKAVLLRSVDTQITTYLKSQTGSNGTVFTPFSSVQMISSTPDFSIVGGTAQTIQWSNGEWLNIVPFGAVQIMPIVLSKDLDEPKASPTTLSTLHHR
ncbi:hypothetical protein BJ742DRAFT_744818 [Cladochytrium replicatum]|nr:hypothetical protein BJ742DRAFT_744818 [Cladochytrium replicatum]